MIVSILLYQDIGTETQVKLDDPSDNGGQREGHYNGRTKETVLVCRMSPIKRGGSASFSVGVGRLII